MTAITRPAVEIQQGKLTLYLTYVTPRELKDPNFYEVEILEPQGSGYQRLLNNTRANRLSRHLSEGFDAGYANLPTNILLATDKAINFDQEKNQISFETNKVCPFNIVDGQHRIEGVIRSTKNKPEMNDFKLPATIAVNLDDTHQMYHFYIVNTTQEPVAQALRQQITSRFSNINGIDKMPYLPHWFQRPVAGGATHKALQLVTFLNENPESPIRNQVHMANDPGKSGNRIKQSGLVNIFKEQILAGTNPISLRETESDRRNKIVLNYFQAIDSLFVTRETRPTTVVYKNTGMYFFSLISRWVFTSMYAAGLALTYENIHQTLKDALESMDQPYYAIADPTWWMSGNHASNMNRAMAREYANELLKALQRNETRHEIQ